MKILVVYFSRTGNTKGVAQAIAAELDADMVQIEDAVKRTGFLGYLQSGRQAAFKKATPIRSIDCSLEPFDLTIVGTPVWCWSLASPVRTFLQHNASHFRDVAFFCTEGGSGGTIAFREMASLCGKRPLAIVVSLHQHAQATGVGEAIPDNTGFLVDLPNRKSFSPDAAYWTGEPPTMKFYQGAPVFAVKVRSESDYGEAAERALAQKREEYFAASTLVVWDVDLQGPDLVTAYFKNPKTAARRYRSGGFANAEPAVPGWQFEVSNLE